ncbi:MAG TPA: hypothetical protein DCL35_00300 [Candidatus Omnitrophica bacterium]|nr:hypothetical protein [Candidatus Omnitrophota bacterium]
MLKEYRFQSVLGVWGGICFFAMGYVFASSPNAVYANFGKLIMSGAYALFISGCFMYAKGKGQSGYWGILGVFGPPGLLLLYCLKDRSKMILKKRQKESARIS